MGECFPQCTRGARARGSLRLRSSERQGLGQQSASFRVFLLNGVLPADGDEELYPIRVIRVRLMLHELLRAREQVIHHEWFARGRCVGEDERVEVVDRLGPRQLTQGGVALDPRGACLDERADDAGDGRDQNG